MFDDFYEDVSETEEAEETSSVDESSASEDEASSQLPEPAPEEPPPQTSDVPASEIPAVVVPEPSPSLDDDTSDGLLDSFLAGMLAGMASDDDSSASDIAEPPQETFELVGIETFALSPVTSAAGLKGKLLDIIGPYDNIVTQFKYQSNTSSNYTYVNEVTPDYPWIASSVLFILLILSLFRLLGRCFSWMK